MTISDRVLGVLVDVSEIEEYATTPTFVSTTFRSWIRCRPSG